MRVEPLTATLDAIVDPRVADWVAAQIPGFGPASGFGPCTAIGIGRAGIIIAGAVYNNYHPCYRDVSISMAATSPAWANRSTISKLLGYPFGQLMVNRLTTFTRASNAKALRLNSGLGFVREGVIRQGYGDGEDMIVMGLLRNDAERWIGQASTDSTRSGSDCERAGRDEQGYGAL